MLRLQVLSYECDKIRMILFAVHKPAGSGLLMRCECWLFRVRSCRGLLTRPFELHDVKATSKSENCKAKDKLHTLEAQANVTCTISDIHSAAGSITAWKARKTTSVERQLCLQSSCTS